MKHIMIKAVSLASVYTLLSAPAHAYIDPGTGALIIQALIGGVATALFTIKLWWRKLLDFIHLRSKKNSVDELEK